MKKFTFILVMIFFASTAYNQSSRRTTSESNNGERTRTARTSSTSTTSPTYASNRSTQNRTSTDRRTTSTTTAHKHTNNKSAHKHSGTTHHRVVKTTSNNKHHHNHSYDRTRHHTVTHNCRIPRSVEVVWTSDMHRHYVKMYPGHSWRHYSYGTRISTIPAYEAKYYIGNVKNVYGRVTDVYYSRETDEFVLSIGRFYPNQYFTVIIPGNLARRQSHRPIDYYLYQDIHVTGLISSYHGEPELFVKRNSQLQVF